MSKIRLGIVGYGNLGKGVALAIGQNNDMELVAIFTRRNPKDIVANHPVYGMDALMQFKGKLDVVILCGGSAHDLPEQIESIATHFNTVDRYDNHAAIPQYYQKVNAVNRTYGTLSLISTGWDPGLFSLLRLLGLSVIPKGQTHTFWGKGISQGHSDAIRRIPGVKNGVQYTIPKDDALEKVRQGEGHNLTTFEKHSRVCYVVPHEDANTSEIETLIKEMPNYFEGYHTTVHFIDEETLKREHGSMPHGGKVIRTGESGNGTRQHMEYSLELGSNPEFTSGVLVAYARAVARLAHEGQVGCRTVFDIPLGYLSPVDPQQLRKDLL